MPCIVGTAATTSTITGAIVHAISMRVLPCVCFGSRSSLRLNLKTMYSSAPSTAMNTTNPAQKITQNINNWFSATGPNVSKVD